MEIKISAPKAPTLTSIPEDVPINLYIIWEEFPRIGEKISIMWGYAELQNYLDNIIMDARGGRLGFPEPVLEALLEIHSLHAMKFHIDPTEPNEKE